MTAVSMDLGAGAGLSVAALADLRRALEETPETVQRELAAAMTEATMLLEREAKEEWPVGVFNSREQITSDVMLEPAGVLGVVGTPSPYAPVIEAGRRPGKGVSQEGQKAIAMWAVARLGVEPARADDVAFLISQKIRRHGIAAKRPMQKVLERLAPDLLRMFDEAIGRVLQGLAGGAAA